MKSSYFIQQFCFIVLFSTVIGQVKAQIDYTIFDFNSEFDFFQHNARAAYPSGDGGYFVFGNIGDQFYADTSKLFVLKTDANGIVIWKNIIGEDDVLNYCNSIFKTPQDDFVMVGHHKEGTGFSDPISPMMAEFDQDGNWNWLMFHAWEWDDELMDVIPDNIGDGYVVIGTTQSFGAGSPNNYNIFMMKTDANGNELFKTVLDGGYDDFGYAVTSGVDGGYMFAGVYESGESLRDLYLIRTDENLNVTWTKLLDETGNDYPFSIATTSDGKYIVAGQTNSYSSSTDAFLLKIDDSGEVDWIKTYGGELSDYAFDVIITQDNHFLFCGKSKSYTPESQIFLVKTDFEGNVIWSEIISYENGSNAYFVYETTMNNFLLAGYYATLSGEYKSMIVDVTDLSTAVKEIPDECFLSCFPNPFMNTLNIEYSLLERDHAKLSIYDGAGRLILTLVNGEQDRGSHSLTLERNNLAPGVYQMVFSTNRNIKTIKVLIVD